MVVHTELSKSVDWHKEPPICGVFSYEENARGEGRGTLQGERWERGKTPLYKTLFSSPKKYFSSCARSSSFSSSARARALLRYTFASAADLGWSLYLT